MQIFGFVKINFYTQRKIRSIITKIKTVKEKKHGIHLLQF